MAEKKLGGVTGKGFLPGHPNGNPNPGGRPKGLMQYARERTRDGKLLVDFAMDVFEGKPIKVSVRTPTGTVEIEVLPTIEQRFQGMEFLADRGFGKPAQKLEGEVRMPISIIHRTPPHDPLAPKPDEERVLDVEATVVPPRRKALKP